MIPKRILALTLFAALAVMPARGLRAQWEQVNGANGGVIGPITISGSNIYAEGDYQVSLSTDTGLTWKAFRLSGNDVNWIGGCGKYVFACTKNRFYVSRNNGTSWIEDSINEQLSSPYFAQIDSVIFASSYVDDQLSVYRSVDSGTTWTNILDGMNFYGCVSAALAVIDTTLYALNGDTGIFRSTDNGTTWSLTASGFHPTGIVAIGTDLLVGDEGSGVMRSTDGSSWIRTGYPHIYTTFLASSGTNIFACDNYDADSGGGVLFRSSDSGKSWNSVKGLGNYLTSMSVYGSDVFVGNSEGLIRSTDNGSTGVLVGLRCFGINSLLNIGNNIFSSGYYMDGQTVFDGDFISTDGGLTWGEADYPVYPDVLIGSSIVGEYFGDTGIAVSTNSGVSWVQSMPNNKTYNSLLRLGKYLFVAASELNNTGGTDSTVFRSSDSGKTWTLSCSGIPKEFFGLLSVLTGNRLFYKGSPNGYSYDNFYLSNDWGVSWQPIDTSGLCCIAPTPSTQMGTVLFGIDSGELYSSTDDGANWELVDSATSNDSLTGINSAVATGNNLFVCAKSGNIFLSTDTGATWKNVNDGLVDSSISFLAVTGQYLFAANTNDSFWRRPLSDFGIAAVAQVNPLANSLKSYPNPLSQSTSITFTLPETSEVTLTITDAAGRETPLLRSAWMDAGQHEITWDATKIPSGVYLCRLSSGGESVTERVVVLK